MKYIDVASIKRNFSETIKIGIGGAFYRVNSHSSVTETNLKSVVLIQFSPNISKFFLSNMENIQNLKNILS